MSDNNETAPLKPERLRSQCDPQKFTFNTTDELMGLESVIGQDRALASVQFLIGIQHAGYNLYALGLSGTGKRAIIQQILEQHAHVKNGKTSDWCYVNNFGEPRSPLVLRLPSGKGPALRQDMETLCEDLQTTIPAVLVETICPLKS
ncbi:MAG: Lon-like protease helical domain-containing protein [Waddliaceae bacterium]